jgi:hypothetical protein
MKLAGFTIEETNDNEDVLLKSITFHLEGTIDEDDIADLSLVIDGETVISDLSINGDEEIIAYIDYTLTADKEAKIELRGTVVSGVGDSIDFIFE